jgi:hypothetical protein
MYSLLLHVDDREMRAWDRQKWMTLTGPVELRSIYTALYSCVVLMLHNEEFYDLNS